MRVMHEIWKSGILDGRQSSPRLRGCEESMSNTGCRPGTDCIGVGVGAVIVDSRGMVFVALRGPKARNEQGRWEFPGGAIQFGETLEEGLRREILEEFGLDISVGELIGVADHILPAHRQHWVSPAFLCTIVSGSPAIHEPEKCEGILWVQPKQLFELELSEASRRTLEDLREKHPGIF